MAARGTVMAFNLTSPPPARQRRAFFTERRRPRARSAPELPPPPPSPPGAARAAGTAGWAIVKLTATFSVPTFTVVGALSVWPTLPFSLAAKGRAYNRSQTETAAVGGCGGGSVKRFDDRYSPKRRSCLEVSR